MRYLINDCWSFGKFAPGTDIDHIYSVLHSENCKSITDEKILKPFSDIDLPHDWMIEDTANLYQSSVGVYVRHLMLDGTKHNAVYFEGVYMRTTVYLNGQKVFFWPYGYTSFEVDLTPYQKDGDNELLVYVDYREPNTRWYSGAGIFRDVWHFEREEIRFITDGIYFNATLCDDGRFKILIDTEVIADSKGLGDAEIIHMISDESGMTIGESRSFIPLYTEKNVNSQFFYLDTVRRWDIDDPYLYTLTTILTYENCTLDIVQQKVGFRIIEFRPESGFFLNGRHVKIHGACMHHDLGCLGSAFNKAAAKRQILELKKMGVNSIRTSHNPPARGLMELADEMGILIDSDAFDMWEMPKTANDYGVFFHEYCERDVESWVRRDRNRPSLIMWSCGNEIPDTNNPDAVKIAERLRDAIRRNDYRHNAYTTIASNYVAWENAQKVQEVFELSGYNYLESVYDEHRIKFPHWCIYGSETASTVQSRGIYHFPKSNRMLTYDDMQCSSLDNCSTNWGAKSVHKFITDDRDRDFCAGQYIWTGWDYIGEPTPYFSKNSFFGHIDTAGFWKDTAYIIKAGWVSPETDPFVHISPYWDFNEGQLIDVDVYSNGHRVELYFNNELVGEKVLDREHDLNFSANFSLPYTKGTLEAKAYDDKGNIIATDTVQSFGNPASIRLVKEAEQICADGEDLMFLRISVRDENGVEVENARNRMTVNITGPARLIGMDNGDSTDYDQYKTNSRKLFSGRLLAVIASTKEPGEIHVKVSSPGLPDAFTSFKSIPGNGRKGVSCLYRVPELSAENAKDLETINEVPVRKLNMMCTPAGAAAALSLLENSDSTDLSELVDLLENSVPSKIARQLGPDNKTMYIKVKTEPADASYRDVHFKAMTKEGIESRAVKVESSGNYARLTAMADGDFRLLASVNNGKNHSEVISELEFSVQGMGSGTLDPYDFVYGCQFARSSVESLLSFRGSVNFGDNNTISFDNVDFGDYGSDELHLSLFSFRNQEDIEIWVGEPDKSELLCKGTYDVPTNYNVLQEDTFKLSKRLKGLRSLTFRFVNGFVLGGFRMTKFEKAYGTISTLEYNMITGDFYEEKADGIYSIGNNVDIEFTGMNFTDGVNKVTITGRANKGTNPVHIRFFKGDEVVKQIVEFPESADFQTLTFPVSGFSGEGKINFIFLPGSDFDFKEFKFEK